MPMARLVASALLAGPWNLRAMLERLGTFLGSSAMSPKHRTLVRAMLAAFPEPPRHARDSLAHALTERAEWSALLRAGMRMRRLVVDKPRMGPSEVRVSPITTVGGLADFLGATVTDLEKLADRRGLSRYAKNERARHHDVRLVPKKDGALRVLEIPKHRLRDLQRRVLDRILSTVPAHPAAYGFVRGRSVLDYARPHAGQALVIRVDLRDFFSSIGAARVGATFRAMGYPDEVRRTLTALTTVATPEPYLAKLPWARRAVLRAAHLAQGAPTSPALANLVAYGLDVRLSALAKKLGATYGRYADDLVLSGGVHLVPRRDALLATLVAIARDEGFEASEKKSRVRRAGEQQKLAGLVVNVHPAVPRAERDRLEAILNNCVKHGPASQNRESRPDFQAWLAGKVAWVEQVRPQHAVHLRELFGRVVW